MSNGIGYAVLPVVPSIRGIGSSVAQQISNPLAQESARAGQAAGRNLRDGILGIAKTIAVPLLGLMGFRAIGNGIRDAINNASDLNEAGTAVGQVFGQSFPQIQKWAAGAATAMGSSTLEALNAAKTFGVYGQSAGLASSANVTFSTGLAQLAGDLASFHNTTPEQAIEAIGAALRGETEPIRAYGILLDDASLRNQAFAMGLTDTTKNVLTPQQRVLAAQALIFKQSTVAQGDFARTSAGLANQQRIMSAQWTDISSRIGSLFLPAIAGAAGAINSTFLPAISGAVDWLQNTAAPIAKGLWDVFMGDKWASEVPPGVTVITDGVGRIWTVVRPIATAVSGAFTSIWQAILPIIPQLVILAQNLFDAYSAIGISVWQLLPTALNLTATAIATVISWISPLLSFLNQNQAVVVSLVAAYAGFRVATTIMGALSAAQAAYAASSYGAAGATYANATAGRIQAIAARAGAAAAWLQNTALVKGTAGWIANTAAIATNETLSTRTKIAIIASSVATGVATAAQWAWNAAMDANPIGIIILAIAALVAGLIWFFTQTELGRDIWTNVTNAIGTAVNWLWTSVIQPVFNFIGAIFSWVYNNIIIPVVTGIMIYIGIWAAIFTWLWNSVLSPVFNFIGAIFTWLWNTIIAVIIAQVVAGVQFWGAVFNWLWANVISPVFNFIGAIFQWLWDTIISPIVGFISLAIQGFGIVVNWLWANVIGPAIRNVGAIFQWLWATIVSPIANFLTTAFNRIGDTARSVFGAIAGFIGSAFNTALSVVRGPINAIIGLINGAIDGLNSIRVTIPAWVPIVGGQTFGVHIPKIPSLATGADIMPRDGGTLAILGEGGQAETVTNLGNTNDMIDTTTALAAAVLAMLRGSGGLAPNVRVFIGDKEITDIIRYEIENADDDVDTTVVQGRRPEF